MIRDPPLINDFLLINLFPIYVISGALDIFKSDNQVFAQEGGFLRSDILSRLISELLDDPKFCILNF
jgi:hypothetical protein